MDKTARFRFIGALNDFLPKAQREQEIRYCFKGTPAVKDAIEALGIPHPEVAAILVNTNLVLFTYLLQVDDTVEVYPPAHLAKWPQVPELRATVPYLPSFILDVHLGKLAKSLRLLGFDTIYENDYSDQTIAEIAVRENRIILTRDVGLLKLKTVQWGYWLRSQNSEQQLAEVLNYFTLHTAIKPFTRCLVCNGTLKSVPKETVLEHLPPKTKIYFQEFHQCQTCGRVFWKGSHYGRMEAFVQQFN